MHPRMIRIAMFLAAATVNYGDSFVYQSTRTLSMRIPYETPWRRHTKVPVARPGVHALSSLRVNQHLSGTVISLYEGTRHRKLFVDVGVTRTDARGRHFPVFGMVRLQGPYQNKTYTYGQQVQDLYVRAVFPEPARLFLSLTPVYKRPVSDGTGEPLPVHRLQDLKVGMPLLNATVVSLTDNYCFLDAGVVRGQTEAEQAKMMHDGGKGGEKGTPRRRLRHPKPRPLMGRLYRGDLLEQYALTDKFRTATTKAVLTPGMSLPVYVKGVHLDSWQYSLTVDPEMTEEKAAALKEERKAQLKAQASKQPVDALLIGESRKGVITKILPGGVKVGIGVKITGFVPLDSVSEAYGEEIKDLSRVLVVGGRLQVEVDEVSDDGKRIDLRCLEIFPQVGSTKKTVGKAGKADQASGRRKESVGEGAKKGEQKRMSNPSYDDDDDDDDYGGDEDDYDRLGYDDEW